MDLLEHIHESAARSRASRLAADGKVAVEDDPVRVSREIMVRRSAVQAARRTRALVHMAMIRERFRHGSVEIRAVPVVTPVVLKRRADRRKAMATLGGVLLVVCAIASLLVLSRPGLPAIPVALHDVSVHATPESIRLNLPSSVRVEAYAVAPVRVRVRRARPARPARPQPRAVAYARTPAHTANPEHKALGDATVPVTNPLGPVVLYRRTAADAPTSSSPAATHPYTIMSTPTAKLALVAMTVSGKTMISAYRVGQTLPDGDVIQSIDAKAGAVHTSEGVLRVHGQQQGTQ